MRLMASFIIFESCSRSPGITLISSEPFHSFPISFPPVLIEEKSLLDRASFVPLLYFFAGSVFVGDISVPKHHASHYFPFLGAALEMLACFFLMVLVRVSTSVINSFFPPFDDRHPPKIHARLLSDVSLSPSTRWGPSGSFVWTTFWAKYDSHYAPSLFFFESPRTPFHSSVILAPIHLFVTPSLSVFLDSI